MAGEGLTLSIAFDDFEDGLGHDQQVEAATQYQAMLSGLPLDIQGVEHDGDNFALERVCLPV